MKILFLAILGITVCYGTLWPNVPKADDCQATAVAIAFNDETKSLLLTWTAPTVCPADNPTYKVVLTIDGEAIELSPIKPGVPMVQYILGKAPTCEKITAQVKTKDSLTGEELATTEPVNLPIVLPNITGVDVTQNSHSMKVTWNPMGDAYAHCNIRYSVTINTEPVIVYTPEHIVNYIEPCKIYLIGITGMSKNNYRTKLYLTSYGTKLWSPDVTRYETNQDGEVTIQFTPLADIPAECGDVTYKIVEKGQECFKSSFSVIAVIASTDMELDGLEDPKLVSRKPSTVNNLRADVRKEEILLEWSPPTGGDKCYLRYGGEYDGQEFSNEVHGTSRIITDTINACKVKTAKVWAIITNYDNTKLKGEEATIDIPGDLGQVSNLKCTIGKTTVGQETVSCSWSKPSGCADSNDITYKITYYDGSTNNNVASNYEDEKFEFEVTNCDRSWILVTPILAGTINGISSEVKPDCSRNRTFWNF